jgi:pimeloyl-ACP methyl ester carboxylesterase
LAADASGIADSRPPLVFLHGVPFDRTMWRPALRELELLDPGRRAVAFDLPGHGQSPDLPSYSLPKIVARVHSAIEEAELARPILVGHAASAVTATLYACVHPTSGVVNVGQSMYVTPFASFVKTHAAEIQGAGFEDVWRRLWTSMHTDLLPPDACRLLADTCRPRQEVMVGYWRDVLDRSLVDISVWAATRLAALRATRVPLQLVVGDAPKYGPWLRAQVPGTAITVLPRSGHFPHLAHPLGFARSIHQFAVSTSS